MRQCCRPLRIVLSVLRRDLLEHLINCTCTAIPEMSMWKIEFVLSSPSQHARPERESEQMSS